MASSDIQRLTEIWLQDLKKEASINIQSSPNYWDTSPSALLATSQVENFTLGTGSQILSSAFSTCAATNHELIILTCFWATSQSQSDICSLLLRLSAKAESLNHKIQVRICFSSLSLFQKLFHTSSLDGKIYPPETWVALGLPAPQKLRNLELVVKSCFFRPFSVWHPKFILMDRTVAFMPSCNVSWEEWFEGCIEMRGEITGKLYDFWNVFWSRGAKLPDLPESMESGHIHDRKAIKGDLIKKSSFPESTPAKTILLPSPHHSNPRLFAKEPPPTPLNTFLLHIINTSKRSIYIQTPNLTSRPAITALLSALTRGINIHIVTSRSLMILEQLITAGTLTEIEIWRLQRNYNRLLSTYHHFQDLNLDLESNPRIKPGVLRIEYFRPRKGREHEPVKSHLKMTVVDGEVVVLGSGNMDRASWFTSQELGVAIFGRKVVERIKSTVEEGLEGRVEVVC